MLLFFRENFYPQAEASADLYRRNDIPWSRVRRGLDKCFRHRTVWPCRYLPRWRWGASNDRGIGQAVQGLSDKCLLCTINLMVGVLYILSMVTFYSDKIYLMIFLCCCSLVFLTTTEAVPSAVCLPSLSTGNSLQGYLLPHFMESNIRSCSHFPSFTEW